MAFTYTEDLTIARDYVRFHCGDTVEDQAFLSDEIITSLIATESSNNAAVIAALLYIRQRMNQPTFKADWLTVDPSKAVEMLDKLINDKRREFGLPKYSASATHVYRTDSAATEEPDYTNGRP